MPRTASSVPGQRHSHSPPDWHSHSGEQRIRPAPAVDSNPFCRSGSPPLDARSRLPTQQPVARQSLPRTFVRAVAPLLALAPLPHSSAGASNERRQSKHSAVALEKAFRGNTLISFGDKETQSSPLHCTLYTQITCSHSTRHAEGIRQTIAGASPDDRQAIATFAEQSPKFRQGFTKHSPQLRQTLGEAANLQSEFRARPTEKHSGHSGSPFGTETRMNPTIDRKNFASRRRHSHALSLTLFLWLWPFQGSTNIAHAVMTSRQAQVLHSPYTRLTRQDSSVTCHAITQGHACRSLWFTYTVTQSLAVHFSATASREEGCAVVSIRTCTRVGQGRGSARAIPSRKVVGKEEAFEHSPQEQHDHQYHEHL